MARPKKSRAEKKIDIFVILEALDLGDMTIYDQIAADPGALAEFQKEIGFILPIWMTGSARDSDHMDLITRFNKNCNRGWFDLAKHPRLQTKLLATVGPGRRLSHRFSKVKGVKKSAPLFDLLRRDHPDIRPSEVQLWARQNTLEQALERARGYGYLDEDLADLEKDYAMVAA